MYTPDSHTHHATLIVSENRKAITENLWKELSALSRNNVRYEQTVLDIETARALISWNNAPYIGKKIALIAFHSATIPAQNALLKVLEEPSNGTSFILVTSNKEALLPTLLSRLQETKVKEHIENTDSHHDAQLFLKTPQADRMKLASVTALLTKTDEEGRKDRESLKAFILSLAQGAAGVKPSDTQEILTIASYAGDPSSSGKALLEYLSLLLPQTK